MSKVLQLWEKMSTKPAGKWLFSKAVCVKAPYFSTIRPLFTIISPQRCEAKMSHSRSIQNHIGTVHAIAMCNLAELVGGTLTEVMVPKTHQWIPKGMTVEYLKKATTDLIATATPIGEIDLSRNGEFKVNVAVTDTLQQHVFNAVITMYVSVKKS